MSQKKLFGKVRSFVVAGTIASLGALMGGCSSSDKAGDKSCGSKSCGGHRMDAADPMKSCGGDKSCGAKSCGGETSGAQKSCGAKSCGK